MRRRREAVGLVWRVVVVVLVGLVVGLGVALLLGCDL